jgi:5-formyltetrahydrofolate cyclo-ligase
VSEALPAAKRRLRREIQARRQGVSPDEAARAGEAVCAHLKGWGPFRGATRVALYAALADELPTRPTFEAVIESGRQALMPRVGGDGSLAFCGIGRWDELVPGSYGVLAPPPGAESVRLGGDDLLLVPGVAFDDRGMRLGRGRGYYDRAFPERTGGPRLCGVAYELQLVDAVPHGSHDRRMDAIVTERGLWKITESG